MGVKIMVKVRPVSKLDKCEVSDINIKYTLITLRSIYCVKRFPQADLDVDIFMDPPLGMGVNENRGKWVINWTNQFTDSIKKAQIGLIS